jgi:hypothetical protein
MRALGLSVRSPAPAALVVATLVLARRAPRGRGNEAVVTDFDLLGWRRLGVLAVDTPPLQVGGAEALLDGDARTFAQLPGPVGDFTLTFRPSQSVRRVAAVPAVAGPARVSLTVIEDDGDRFQAGVLDVAAGGEAVFRLMDQLASALEVRVESARRPVGRRAGRRAGRGPHRGDGLVARGRARHAARGRQLPAARVGRDVYGGRPDLTGLAQVIVQPAPALSLQGGRRADARAGAGRRSSRASGRWPAHRAAAGDADGPAAARAGGLAGMHVVELALLGRAALRGLPPRRGEKESVSIGRALRTTFFDDTVQPGSAYSYSARRVDLMGNVLTAVGPRARVRTHGRLPPGVREVGRLPLLVRVFTDSLEPGEIADVVDSVQAARLFVWRHTLGRVVLDPVVLEVPGPVPVTAGPTMVAVEARLRELGVRDDGFSVVAAVSPDFEGDYSGFRVLGDAAGLLLRGTSVPTPGAALGPSRPWRTACCTSCRNRRGPAAGRHRRGSCRGPPRARLRRARVAGQPHGRTFDAGEAWDQTACCSQAPTAGRASARRGCGRWRCWTPTATSCPTPTTTCPWTRRASAPTRCAPTPTPTASATSPSWPPACTAAATRSRPTATATASPTAWIAWPTSNFTGVIPSAARRACWPPCPPAPRPTRRPSRSHASWSRTALTLQIVTDEPCDVFLDLDGSGRLGRWESDANTGTREVPAGDCWCGPSASRCAPTPPRSASSSAATRSVTPSSPPNANPTAATASSPCSPPPSAPATRKASSRSTPPSPTASACAPARSWAWRSPSARHATRIRFRSKRSRGRRLVQRLRTHHLMDAVLQE